MYSHITPLSFSNRLSYCFATKCLSSVLWSASSLLITLILCRMFIFVMTVSRSVYLYGFSTWEFIISFVCSGIYSFSFNILSTFRFRYPTSTNYILVILFRKFATNWMFSLCFISSPCMFQTKNVSSVVCFSYRLIFLTPFCLIIFLIYSTY